MSNEEREPPVHRGVIFVEINKQGVCRVTGYTGSKEEGDQNLVLNLSASNQSQLDAVAPGLLKEIVGEMFKAWRNLQRG